MQAAETDTFVVRVKYKGQTESRTVPTSVTTADLLTLLHQETGIPEPQLRVFIAGKAYRLVDVVPPILLADLTARGSKPISLFATASAAEASAVQDQVDRGQYSAETLTERKLFFSHGVYRMSLVGRRMQRVAALTSAGQNPVLHQLDAQYSPAERVASIRFGSFAPAEVFAVDAQRPLKVMPALVGLGVFPRLGCSHQFNLNFTAPCYDCVINTVMEWHGLMDTMLRTEYEALGGMLHRKGWSTPEEKRALVTLRLRRVALRHDWFHDRQSLCAKFLTEEVRNVKRMCRADDEEAEVFSTDDNEIELGPDMAELQTTAEAIWCDLREMSAVESCLQDRVPFTRFGDVDTRPDRPTLGICCTGCRHCSDAADRMARFVRGEMSARFVFPELWGETMSGDRADGADRR